MKSSLLFVYGILKRGYALDLGNEGAKFLGEAHIENATLYGIGPYGVGSIDDEVKYHGVGLRLNEPGNVAHGELWQIPDNLWGWLDGIEQNGFCYERKIVQVKLLEREFPDGELMKNMKLWKPIDAYVYEHCYPNFKYENKIKGGRF